MQICEVKCTANYRLLSASPYLVDVVKLSSSSTFLHFLLFFNRNFGVEFDFNQRPPIYWAILAKFGKRGTSMGELEFARIDGGGADYPSRASGRAFYFNINLASLLFLVGWGLRSLFRLQCVFYAGISTVSSIPVPSRVYVAILSL